MKTTIFILFLFISAAARTQTTTIPLALRMDLITQVTFTEKDYLKNGAGTLKIHVIPYTVKRVDSSGQLYIEFTNSRFSKHRKYLGWSWGVHEYEGNTIFFNKDTTQAWIWTVDRYGQIFKMDLPDHLSNDARTIKDSIP